MFDYRALIRFALFLSLAALVSADKAVQLRSLAIETTTTGPVVRHVFQQFPALACSSARNLQTSRNTDFSSGLLPSKLGLALQQCSSGNCGTGDCNDGYPLTSCSTYLVPSYYGICGSCATMYCESVQTCSCCVGCAYYSGNECASCPDSGGCHK